jgi:hypothetical protein
METLSGREETKARVSMPVPAAVSRMAAVLHVCQPGCEIIRIGDKEQGP